MTDISDSIRHIKRPTILLYSGGYFDFLDPEGSEFYIEDIAHALANTCRFNGHCHRFYSVAQHSEHLSKMVPPEDAYAGLMHDAAEAFVGDVVKPLKDLLPEFGAIEDRVEAVVFAQFGVPCPLPESVKEADIRMLATEQFHLMANRDDWDYTYGRKPYEILIPTWSPKQAEVQFLLRYRILKPR